MNCEIIFTIGDKTITMGLKNSTPGYLTPDEILQALSNSDNKDNYLKLLEQIKESLSSIKNLKKFTISNYLKNSDGLYGNSSLEELTKEFGINFPDGVSANILLVDNLKLRGKTIRGRVINSNGEELFVISGKDDVYRLSGFLKVRQQLESKSYLIADDSPLYADLIQCLNLRNNNSKKSISDVYEMCLEFIENPELYEGLYFDNKSVYVILDRLVREIRDFSDKINYENPFVNVINRQFRRSKDSLKISIDTVYSDLNQYYPELLNTLKIFSSSDLMLFFSNKAKIKQLLKDKLKIKSEKDISKLQEITEETKDIITKIYQSDNGMYSFFEILFSSEPTFQANFSKREKNDLIFKTVPKTIYQKYGVTYQTIQLMEEKEEYRGYKIFQYNNNGVNEYYTSREYLTENSYSKKFVSIEEVKEYINEKIQSQDLYSNSLVEFNFRNKTEELFNPDLDSYTINTNYYLLLNSVIEVYNIPVDPKTKIYNNEDILFKNRGYTLDKFYSMTINSWEITPDTKQYLINTINTPYKAVLFLYKVNERLLEDRSNNEELLNIANEINNSEKISYYIDQKTKLNKKVVYTIIPTDANVVKDYKKQHKLPSVTLMQAISEVFDKKFGTSVTLLTSEELKNSFPNINVNTTKAFIRENQIYINTDLANTSDLIHEYSHLLLGILKANVNLRGNYEQLLYTIAENSKDDLQLLKQSYPDISQIDLMEELFVKKFSEFIMGSLNSTNLEQLFKSQSKILEDTTQIIFSEPIGDIKSFYGKTIYEVFTRFSSDVATLLQNNETNFATTKQYRQYSNWISEQIKQEKIIENCK